MISIFGGSRWLYEYGDFRFTGGLLVDGVILWCESRIMDVRVCYTLEAEFIDREWNADIRRRHCFT